jgi:hypothetical protein
MGPRTGSASSTPPKRSTLLRIASAGFPACAGSCARAVRKNISRLVLHRPVPLRRPQPQLSLHRLIQIADRDAGHARLVKSLQSIESLQLIPANPACAKSTGAPLSTSWNGTHRLSHWLIAGRCEEAKELLHDLEGAFGCLRSRRHTPGLILIIDFRPASQTVVSQI